MDSSTTELLKWIITGALGTGWITTFLFYRTRRRKANAEADKEETEADKQAFEALGAKVEHLKRENKEGYETIEKLQTIINELRDKNLEQAKKISELEMKLLGAERKQRVADYEKCVVENCCDRTPKRENDLCIKHKKNEGSI